MAELGAAKHFQEKTGVRGFLGDQPGRSAIQNAIKAPKGRAFLRALTTLCKTMKVETIAEMVDSKEALEFVRDCGVDHVQGWLFGKPDQDPWSFIKKLDRRLFS